MGDWIKDNLAAELLMAALAALGGLLVVRYKRTWRVRAWSWATWLWHFRLGFFLRQQGARRNARIICLEEYVDELTRAREKIAAFVRKTGTKKCEVLVRIFTMQLPSDWPLWFGGAQDDLRTTPLGRYILGFKDFVSGQGKYHSIPVHVERYIVIDNIGSPNNAGERRLRQLISDLRAEWYASYKQLLHGADDTAFCLKYRRPWPGWLSDSVFFGLRLKDDDHGDDDHWLWALTTSYNPGEDVLIYRYHRLRHPGPTPKDLPEGVQSIEEMPISQALRDLSVPLSSLLAQASEAGNDHV